MRGQERLPVWAEQLVYHVQRLRTGDPVGGRPAIIFRPATPYTFDNEDYAELVRALISETDLMADRVEIRTG
jgi:hypothetical protein